MNQEDLVKNLLIRIEMLEEIAYRENPPAEEQSQHEIKVKIPSGACYRAVRKKDGSIAFGQYYDKLPDAIAVFREWLQGRKTREQVNLRVLTRELSNMAIGKPDTMREDCGGFYWNSAEMIFKDLIRENADLIGPISECGILEWIGGQGK